jgi:hypothetical protein
MDFGGSVQTSIFAYLLMAVVAMLAAVMVRAIVIVLERAQQRRKAEVAPTPVSISVAPAVDETAAHVAAVAAAVYAVLGAHRLVHIGEAMPGPAWTATGRLAHHVSHMPRRTGR